MKTLLICSSVIAIMLVAAPTASADWIGFGGHLYMLTSSAEDWFAAQNEARLDGGNLVTINNASEQAFLEGAFLTGVNERRPLWIGLTDVGSEFGVFRWISGEPVTYTNWQPGQPSDPAHDFFVAMNWDHAANTSALKGTWNDLPVNGTTGGSANTNGPYFGIIEAAVPEPSSIVLLTTGLLILAGYALRIRVQPQQPADEILSHQTRRALSICKPAKI